MPDWFVDAYDLRPEDHLEMQALIQRYVDGAVSKTINLPENFKSTELDTLLLEYIKDLKGVTVYRDGAKGNQPLKRIPTKDIQKWVDAGKVDLADCILVQGCPDGNCEI